MKRALIRITLIASGATAFWLAGYEPLAPSLWAVALCVLGTTAITVGCVPWGGDE